jgi:hypothetical protein
MWLRKIEIELTLLYVEFEGFTAIKCAKISSA